MKNRIAVVAIASLLATAAAPALAQPMMGGTKAVTVGGAPMYPSRNIVQNAVNSKDHTTLVAAVKAAGLVDTLQSPGPFTVFAPTNRAFGKLPKGTVKSLVRPENRQALTGILTYHVVAGRYTAQDLMSLVERGGGKAMLTTVQGEPLTITQASRTRLTVSDRKGDVATITIPNVLQSNGVIHVVDTVLLPT